jgi:hypothetical protein
MELLHVFGNICTYGINVVKYEAEFLYLGLTVTNQNCVYGEIQSILNLENARYCSVQSPLSSCLLSESVDCNVPGLPFFISFLHHVGCGCVTWFHTLTEEYRRRLLVFEKWMLMRIYGPERGRRTLFTCY